MSDSRELRVLRMMAWERAKGELRSMLNTYWDDHDRFTAMNEVMTEFVKHVEDNALEE